MAIAGLTRPATLSLDSRPTSRYYFGTILTASTFITAILQPNTTMIQRTTPDSIPDKPDIEYPCTWVYKVIGEDPTLLNEVILTACAPAPVRITPSHTSSGGKYHSVDATLVVDSEEMRLQIYEVLKSHPGVKVVL
ncbi:MAG: DUF493 domain-containing protein [Desulfopila sp.]